MRHISSSRTSPSYKVASLFCMVFQAFHHTLDAVVHQTQDLDHLGGALVKEITAADEVVDAVLAHGNDEC
jgi:hypothetical protein